MFKIVRILVLVIFSMSSHADTLRESDPAQIGSKIAQVRSCSYYAGVLGEYELKTIYDNYDALAIEYLTELGLKKIQTQDKEFENRLNSIVDSIFETEINSLKHPGIDNWNSICYAIASLHIEGFSWYK